MWNDLDQVFWYLFEARFAFSIEQGAFEMFDEQTLFDLSGEFLIKQQ